MGKLIWEGESIGADPNKLLFSFLLFIAMLLLVFPEVETQGEFMPPVELVILLALGVLAFSFWTSKKTEPPKVFSDGILAGNMFFPKKGISELGVFVNKGSISAIITLSTVGSTRKVEVVKYREFLVALENMGLKLDAWMDLPEGRYQIIFRRKNKKAGDE